MADQTEREQMRHWVEDLNTLTLFVRGSRIFHDRDPVANDVCREAVQLALICEKKLNLDFSREVLRALVGEAEVSTRARSTAKWLLRYLLPSSRIPA